MRVPSYAAAARTIARHIAVSAEPDMKITP
jgi:hypothetical protein